MQILLDRCTNILTAVETQASAVITSIKTAIDDKIFEQGHMTTGKFQDILSDYMEAYKKEIAELRVEVRALNKNPLATTNPNAQGTTSSHRSRCAFAYSDRFFYVLKDFQFPKNINLRSGLRFWFNVLTLSNSSDFLKPFRHITLK